jgi:predicted Rossmann fold flavoprotein
MTYDLIVAGGGAAGFFTAVECASQMPGLKIIILEKTTKLLSKVRVSGGGRCNVTHNCFEPTPLSKHYPRGQKELKQLFRVFHASDTVEWFRKRGVKLVAEDDGRMFPTTNTSETIISCFLSESERHGISIEMSADVVGASRSQDHIHVQCRNGKKYAGRNLLIAMGGHPQRDAYQWISSLGHVVTPLIPSLFTFNDPSREFVDLMGVSVQEALVRIVGTKLSSRGPVLLTHWGLSGPAIIRLSSWAAQHLHDVKYEFEIHVNWTGDATEETLRKLFQKKNREEGSKKINSNPLFSIPQRLWDKLCGKAGINTTTTWAEAQAKSVNRLIEFLVRCPFHIRGKTTFKEEFVTCGGVTLDEIDLTKMQSKLVPGIYFAGEVLNVDGETGGFNFQSAWTTAFIAAHSIAGRS